MPFQLYNPGKVGRFPQVPEQQNVGSTEPIFERKDVDGVRKTGKILLILLLAVLLLTGCSLQSQREDAVLQMMDAIARSDREAAAALVHPSEEVDVFLAEFPAICRMMDGRRVDSYRVTQMKWSTTQTESGTQERESGTFTIRLEDDEKFTLAYAYVQDEQGSGFTVFHMSFKKK